MSCQVEEPRPRSPLGVEDEARTDDGRSGNA
jgi:hypothetical protein